MGSIKYALYAITAITFIIVVLKFNPYALKNLSHYGGFMPYGITSLFAAMPIAMFSFGGARTIPDFAEEVKRRRSLIWGLILTVIGQAVIYITFAAIFVLSTDWRALSLPEGDWGALLNIARNPYYMLASAYHLPHNVRITDDLPNSCLIHGWLRIHGCRYEGDAGYCKVKAY